jgi:RNA polymerase sigma-70 factor (ECF subfamily)
MTRPKAPVAQMQTRWSLVAAARGGDAAGPVAELCTRYWYAAYAFLRRSGHPPQVAEDFARGFFHRLVTERLDTIGPRSTGRFREFMVTELRGFMASGPHDRPAQEPLPGVAPPVPVDVLEGRLAVDCREAGSAEQAFEQALAHTLVTRSLERLRAEVEAAGRGAMFAKLQPHLYSEPNPEQQRAICAALGVRPLVVVLGLRSLRQRLRQLVDDEIGQAAGDGADVESERSTLHIVLPA